MKKTLVIIAGGKSSRMKQDKALLPFGEFNSLAEYQYRRLSSYFDKIYISAKNNKFDFDVDIIEDKYNNSSPLVALVSIFETLQEEEVFILSVDAPFVTTQTIEKLYMEAEDESSAIVVESNNGLEPLCGIYRQSILNRAKEFLIEDNHRLQALLNSINTQKVKINHNEFMNLNHPFEYEKAKNQLDFRPSFNI
jgi:molybdopterin-guanine dinucleotide biosynthesis protein A